MLAMKSLAPPQDHELSPEIKARIQLYENIPGELQVIPQWIVWRYEDIGAAKPTKIPYDPKTKNLASVTDPNTWASFNDAIRVSHHYSGIGFVLTSNDPYTFIDLDDCRYLNNGAQNPNYDKDLRRQLDIFGELKSYSERSPSGTGLHIITRGFQVPSGRRRSFIEIYSDKRYATFTGDVYKYSVIKRENAIVKQLYEQMGGGEAATYVFSGDVIQRHEDTAVIEMATNAANGAKFLELSQGRWQDLYRSQSEADLAYIDIVAFYSQNREQIARIFRNSPLGQRAKARRVDYVNWMINKSFDKMLPSIDIEGFQAILDAKLEEQGEVANANVSVPATFNSSGDNVIPLPPGLMGDIAKFIYEAAPRQVENIAIAASIALMAAICGKAYNFRDTGLNMYVILIAETGRGKEAMSSGIDKLIDEVRKLVPTVNDFIGPSEISSGQALIRHLHKQPCFLSIMGEIGLRLSKMSGEKISPADQTLKRVWLECYQKSGGHQILRSSIYADKDKDAPEVYGPSFSLLGESTGEQFYGGLNEEMIANGFLPRFLVIEHKGKRKYFNYNAANAKPEWSLVERLADLAANAQQIIHSNKVLYIKETKEAWDILDEIDKRTTDDINILHDSVTKELWNRAHMKIMRLAALVAIGVNPSFPEITKDHVLWAKDVVERDIKSIRSKFEAGEIGKHTASESQQIKELKRLIREFLTKKRDEIEKLGAAVVRLHKAKIIPYSYLLNRCMQLAAYREDRLGVTTAVKRNLQIMLDTDIIREMPKADTVRDYNTGARAFMLKDMGVMDSD